MALTATAVFWTDRRIRIFAARAVKNESCRVLLYPAARTTIGYCWKADLRRADLRLLKLRLYRHFWNLAGGAAIATI